MTLHEFVKKVKVFTAAVGQDMTLTPEIEKFYFKYETALADQGLLVSAVRYSHGMLESSIVSVVSSTSTYWRKLLLLH